MTFSLRLSRARTDKIVATTTIGYHEKGVKFKKKRNKQDFLLQPVTGMLDYNLPNPHGHPFWRNCLSPIIPCLYIHNQRLSQFQ